MDAVVSPCVAVLCGQECRAGANAHHFVDATCTCLLSHLSSQTHTEEGTNATPLPLKNHAEALGAVQSALLDSFGGESLRRRLRGMGHRVVHGLTTSVPVRVDAELMATIRQASALAPLHNPPNAAGIEAAMASFPDVPQVAVFDTAWHAGMPAAAAAYALPRSLCEAQRIRRYGFHGTSYAYLSSRLAQRLDRPLQELSAVLCHLGAGSSVACMRRGRGVDTSMGLTPLEGLVMATRAGDLDPAIVTHLLRQGAGMEQVDELLNKKSGLAGLAGTADMREIVDRAGEGDEDCRLALDVYVHRLRKYLGAYVLQLDGKLDAIVFSAGAVGGGRESARWRGRVEGGGTAGLGT